MLRPDVVAAGISKNEFCGFQLEFSVRKSNFPLQVYFSGKLLVPLTMDLFSSVSEISPSYEALLSTDRVLHREDIYGFGPPATTIAPEILSLARPLPDPILDFGCGSGLLVSHLRKEGHDVCGIELKRPGIVEALTAETSPIVHLYDGEFPLPYRDGQFESVISVEVMEHIPNFSAALQEIARVSRSAFLMTVPDMACIPICGVHNVVPWHLLESTHVNFFTYQSLRKELGCYWTRMEFHRICNFTVNGSFVPGSWAILCQR